jgi:hypothetical protein
LPEEAIIPEFVDCDSLPFILIVSRYWTSQVGLQISDTVLSGMVSISLQGAINTLGVLILGVSNVFTVTSILENHTEVLVHLAEEQQ